MSTLGIVVGRLSSSLVEAFAGTRPTSTYQQIAVAATATIKEAGEIFKTDARADIAAAGFGLKWQNAFRVVYFPKGNRTSVNAAAFGFHKIPYSIVFEEGATIRARAGLLWLPLPSTPKMAGRNKATPKRMIQAGIKLFTIKGRAGKPLLASNIRVSRRQANAPVSSLSINLSKLKRGAWSEKGIARAVPLFIGVESVTVRKRFNIAGVASKVRGQLVGIYVNNISAEA